MEKLRRYNATHVKKAEDALHEELARKNFINSLQKIKVKHDVKIY